MAKIDETLSPVYLLRSYTWALLKANDPDVWDEDKYGGMIPIVPLAEEPELDQFNGPHMVYGYAIGATGRLNAMTEGSLTYAIYDQNFRRLTKTLIILQSAFERQDESARDVTAYGSLVQPQTGVFPYRGIRFGSIDIGFVEGGSPEETEGGRQSALINIRFNCFVDYDVETGWDAANDTWVGLS